jgi:hypothetical protein
VAGAADAVVDRVRGVTAAFIRGDLRKTAVGELASDLG